MLTERGVCNIGIKFTKLDKTNATNDPSTYFLSITRPIVIRQIHAKEMIQSQPSRGCEGSRRQRRA